MWALVLVGVYKVILMGFEGGAVRVQWVFIIFLLDGEGLMEFCWRSDSGRGIGEEVLLCSPSVSTFHLDSRCIHDILWLGVQDGEVFGLVEDG